MPSKWQYIELVYLVAMTCMQLPSVVFRNEFGQERTTGEVRGKKLDAAGCKLKCLQPLTKRKIDPTYRCNNTIKTLPDRLTGEVYPLFCERGGKHSCLQPAASNFFSIAETVASGE